MDEVYEMAVQRADELRAELNDLNAYIELHRRTRQRLGMDSPAQNQNTSPVVITAKPILASDLVRDEAQTKRQRVSDNPKPVAVVQAARRIIEERGRPMSRRELHGALASIGLDVNGADPIKALGTMLWRSGEDVLVQLKGFGYWIKDRDYEPAHYDTDPTFDLSERAEEEVEVDPVEFV